MTANTHASGARFRIEASASNPDERQDNRREEIADYQPKADALNRVREYHRQGYWVEVFDVDTGELRAGPIDPDRKLPALYIGG